MRLAVLLVVALTSGANCSHQKPVDSETLKVTQAEASVSAVETPRTEEHEDIPAEFRSIDFKNFSYPTKLRGDITLKDGERIFYNPEGGGDTFSFREVGYVDVTGDGKQEAIVDLSVVSCGASCDGGSHLFYFYSLAQNGLKLLTRIETGSTAYGECGLKSFELNKSNLTLELFQICETTGISFRSLADDKNRGSKFEAQSFTRFQYEFTANGFEVTERRVFPFPQGDVRTFEETISFNN